MSGARLRRGVNVASVLDWSNITSMSNWKSLPLGDSPVPNEENDTFIRQSTINSLQQCGQRVALKSHPGYLEAVSEPLAFGTLTHHIIEQHLASGEMQDKLLMNMGAWVEPILLEEYDWPINRVPDLHLFLGEIAIAYRSWVHYVLPEIQRAELLTQEEKMTLYLGEGRDGNIFLQGTADAVTDKALVDWKTSRRAWKPTKAQFSIQATLYPALVKQNLGRAIRRMDFWVYSRQDSQWVLHTARRTIDEIDTGLKIAYTYGLQLESGILPATPLEENYFDYKRAWYCSPRYCGAWNVCEFKHLPDDKDEDVIAERTW